MQEKNNIIPKIKKREEITELDLKENKIFKPETTIHYFKSDWYRITRLNEIEFLPLETASFTKDIFITRMKKDLKYLEKYIYESKEFKEDKFIFLNTNKSQEIKTGWIDISKGLHLTSDEYSDDHCHVFFYGTNNFNLFELFDLIGNEYYCSASYIDNGEHIKDCDKKFTFRGKFFFYDSKYVINGKEKECKKPNIDYYNLSKMKKEFKKSKSFYITK